MGGSEGTQSGTVVCTHLVLDLCIEYRFVADPNGAESASGDSGGKETVSPGARAILIAEHQHQDCR